jgi:hypothetical protein
VKTATLTTMGKSDQPAGIGSLITADTTVPVDIASVAAEVRRLHASRTGRPPGQRAGTPGGVLTPSSTSRCILRNIDARRAKAMTSRLNNPKSRACHDPEHPHIRRIQALTRTHRRVHRPQ